MTLEEIQKIDFNPDMYEILETETFSDEMFFYLHFKDSYVGEIELPPGYTNCEYLFMDCNIQEGCYLGDKFDTSNIQDMRHMFSSAKLPKNFTLGDKFDTSNVQNMKWMFADVTIPEGFTLGDKFDTSNVQNMESMFYKTKFSKDFTLGDKFDTSNVEDMESMFAYATIPEGFTLGPKFDVSNKKNIAIYMFAGVKLPKNFELNLSFIQTNPINRITMFDNSILPNKSSFELFELEDGLTAFEDETGIKLIDKQGELYSLNDFPPEIQSTIYYTISNQKFYTIIIEMQEVKDILKSSITNNNEKNLITNNNEKNKMHLGFDNEEFIKNRQINKIVLDETSKIDELNNAFEFLNSDIDITRNNIVKKANEYFNKSNKKIFERYTYVNKISKEMATIDLTNDIILNKDNELLNIEKNIVLNDAQTLEELRDLKYNPDIFEIKKCEQIIPNEMSPKNVIKATYYHLHFKDTYEGEIKIPTELSNLDNLFEDCNIKPGCYLSEECDLSKVTSMQDMFKNATGLDDKLFNIDGYTVFKDTNQLIIYNNEGTKCSFDDIILSNPDLLKAINDKLNELENLDTIENNQKEDILNETI